MVGMEPHPLEELREKIGLSWAEFSAVVGLSYPTMRQICRGAARLTEKTANKLYESLKINPMLFKEKADEWLAEHQARIVRMAKERYDEKDA